MKQFIHTHRKALVSGAVCLMLLLSLVGGSWAALSAPRQQPDAPEKKDYPGLNIQQIGLRYDRQSPTQDGAAGDDTGDGQAQQNDPQQETPPQDEAKPNDDQTPEEQPDPGDQDQQPEQKDDQDKKDDEGSVDEDKKDEQPQGPQIATDLRNCTISQDQLQNDLFRFTAMVVGGDEDITLQVRIKNSQTNGKWLTASGDDYSSKLALGRNEITIVMKRGSEIIGQVTRVINYQAVKASEDDPEKGDNPPKIRTNLSGDTIKLTNRNLTFTVWATDGEDNPLYQDHITVKLDGREVKYSTGSGASGLEYNLRLDGENGGRHTVTILAWDDKGNSTYKTYIIDYDAHEKGEKIGTATVRLDLSVLGLGIIEAPVSTDIFQDVPASYAITEVLESLGYTVSYGGTLDSGFYLKRISRSMTFGSANIPQELQKLLENDGISISKPDNYTDSLGEFDYTNKSGWMYAINGVYPGRGFSEYFLSDGDVLTLRFTLALGRDIGGGSASNGQANYCGTWIDGRYIPNHTYKDGKCTICGAADPAGHTHEETETITKAATCTKAGEKTLTCSVCGETHTERIPATGHSYHTECKYTGNGYTLTATCTTCGQTHTETVSSDQTWEISRTEPTCTSPGSVTRRVFITVDGQNITADVTETLPQLDHTYDANGVCSGCGQRDPSKPEPTPDPEPEPVGEETQNENDETAT